MKAERNLAQTNDHVFAFKENIVSHFKVSAIGRIVLTPGSKFFF